MRILFCTNSLGARGGIERVTIVKANALADTEGVEVCVCYTDKGTYPESTIHPVSPKVATKDLGVPFWDLYPLSLKALLVTAPKKFLRLRKALKRVIADFDPDVVITTGSYEKYALATLRLKKAVKIREFHFNSQYRRFNGSSRMFRIVEWLEYNLLGRCFDMNLLLTKEDRDKYFPGRKNYDFQHNPGSFVCNNITPANERKNVVLAVGRLAPEKNFEGLLRVWANAHPHMADWQLWIAGEGVQHDQLEALINELHIADSVKLLGYCSDVAGLMAQSRILAATSLYEGFGLNIIEGMSCGVVPISYATPHGPCDIINDGVDGVLIPYLDEATFARRLVQLASDPAEIERMSANAVKRSRDFSVATITSQLIDRYTRLISLKEGRLPACTGNKDVR